MSTSASRPVLVGIDGTEESLRACDHAWAEARARGCGVVLVHAFQPIVSDGVETPFGLAEMRQEGHRVLREAALHLRRLGAGDDDVRVALTRGRPTRVLAKDSRAACLLVIGRRPSVAGHTVSGSKAVGLAALSACPVVVVPAHHDVAVSGPIVVGVDDSRRSAEAIGFAFDEAERLGCGVLAVQAWQVPGAAASAEDGRVWRAQGENHASRVLADALADARAAHPSVTVDAVSREGRAAEVLLASAVDARMLVVGSRGSGGAAGVAVGSVTRQVLASARVPVVVVRHLHSRVESAADSVLVG